MQPQIKQSAERTIAPITTFDVDLSVARDQVIPVQGDFFMLDMASTGKVLLDINVEHQSTDPLIYAARGFSYSGNFGNFRIKNTAQPGKFVRIVVGRGATIKGAASDGATYSPIGNKTQCVTFMTGVVTGPTMATPFVSPVVANAQNTNGILVRRSYVVASAVGGGSNARISLVAKAAAATPDFSSNRYETALLANVSAPRGNTNATYSDAGEDSVLIPAGWRLDYLFGIGDAGSWQFSGDICFEIL